MATTNAPVKPKTSIAERFAKRRTVLVWMAGGALAPLVATPALGEERAATPEMTEGPFYPRRMPSDVDADLTRVEGHAQPAQGTVLDVSGRVLDRSGRPVANATIEIWQCDARGRYHHVGEPEGDGDFQGYGRLVADAGGTYRFRTIKPVPYPGRAPHIHFTVLERGRRRLTSQMFVEGDPGNARDGLYRALGPQARLVTLRLESAGAALRGTLDIVLA